jgi:hypothetical protein
VTSTANSQCLAGDASRPDVNPDESPGQWRPVTRDSSSAQRRFSLDARAAESRAADHASVVRGARWGQRCPGRPHHPSGLWTARATSVSSTGAWEENKGRAFDAWAEFPHAYPSGQAWLGRARSPDIWSRWTPASCRRVTVGAKGLCHTRHWVGITLNRHRCDAYAPRRSDVPTFTPQPVVTVSGPLVTGRLA